MASSSSNTNNVESDDTLQMPDSPRSMTDEELQIYYEVVSKSEGFEVPYFPGTYAYGRIESMGNFEAWQPELDQVGDEVMKHYNEKNDTNLEIVEFVKVNYQVVSGLIFYLTFKAKPIGTPADHPTTTFQSEVFDGIKVIDVKFCRPVPSASLENESSSTTSSSNTNPPHLSTTLALQKSNL